jgi:TPR repeat protein
LEQNYAKAVKYYQLGADQGHAPAQHNIGVMYANGTGVTRNLSTALKWFKLAALQSYPNAQSALANSFFSPGTRVEIEGLKSNASLNGSVGTVANHLNPERCSVIFDGHKKPMSVRYTNLNQAM